MKNKKTYAVFGLGRYGCAVAKELVRCGMEVLAIDMDETLVNAAIADIPYCKCADVTDKEVLEQTVRFSKKSVRTKQYSPKKNPA